MEYLSNYLLNILAFSDIYLSVRVDIAKRLHVKRSVHTELKK